MVIRILTRKPPRAAVVIISAAALVAGTALAFRATVASLPSIAALEDYTPSQVTRVYDRSGVLITELFTERRTLIPLRQIPVDLQNALLAIEDRAFFKHWGISPRGIVRAVASNLIQRRVAQGGSTLTQQLAKTIFLTPDRTLARKIKELLLTLQLERQYSKEEILQLYLNQVYFGSGAYGVESAARTYFGKHVADLNLAECALLAGLPRAPSYYSPLKSPERAIQRRAVVLRRMRELGYIKPDEEAAAASRAYMTSPSAIPTGRAPYFIEFIRQILEPVYGTDMIYRGGLSIYTTLDITAQESAERALAEGLAAFDTEKAGYAVQGTTPTVTQGALLALDPLTGGIRAMVGGRDFRASQFNRTTQAVRQPGSSFKIFVYTAALENGFTPASMLNDTPLVYVNDGMDWRLAARDPEYLKTLPPEWIKDPMKVWAPDNYTQVHVGTVSLRTALEHSLNVCAVEVIDAVRPERVIDYARRMGITNPLTNTLSLALGASGVSLIEMVRGTAVLASGGIRAEPYAIVRVEDRNGRILEEHLPSEQETLSPQTCFVMTSLLRGVVERGTGQGAKALGRPCAGKTGTTNNFSDAWFVGYTPQLAAGVWVGNDDMSPLGPKITGGRIACPIWTSFMKGALSGQPVLSFKPPPGIGFALIDPRTGLLALSSTPGAYLESFLKGTEPREYARTQNTPPAAVPVEDGAGF